VDTCFVAMPITTPPTLVGQYDNDQDHFLHILDHLFIPAIERAGLKAISPITQGSAVIHAEIIKQITDAQLVLCDMSTLNANVFFELGIRTALDLPVCLVLDTKTERAPFDLTLVNHYTYNPALSPWILKDEIPRLQKHIETTLAAGDHNAMWGVVALARRAEVRTDPSDPTVARIELLEAKFDLLANSRYDMEGPGRKLAGKRILWVDDSPENNLSEVRNLEALGAMVISATSTVEALDILAKNKRFDLVISDVGRLEGGAKNYQAGFEFLSRLREDLKVYIPLVYYTSDASLAGQNDVARKYRAPAADSPSTLLDLVTHELTSVNQ